MTSNTNTQVFKAALRKAITSGDRTAIDRLINNIVPSATGITNGRDSGELSTTDNDGFAFVFDIDGVLIHNKNTIPYATETVHYLIDNSISFIFLTNSGGETEAKRIAGLNKRFHTTALSKDQFVQSHTPFRDLVPQFQNKTVLVIGGGGEGARQVALDYGFQSVITTSDVLMSDSSFWPFLEQSKTFHQRMAKPLPKPFTPHDPTNSLQVALILVFSSPRDWGLDAQLCLDLLLSDSGVLGTKSPLNDSIILPNFGYQQQPTAPKLVFSNPDFVWKTDYQHGPRFGQGAFITALEAIFHEATDHKAYLQFVKFGKPERASYLYAEDSLTHKRANMEEKNSPKAFKNVYMIGDNPASDIEGANNFQSTRGTAWGSVLVETGVYEKGTVPKTIPSVIVHDVFDAVNWVLKREGKTEMVRASTPRVLEVESIISNTLG